jgi:hypothetical protein
MITTVRGGAPPAACAAPVDAIIVAPSASASAIRKFLSFISLRSRSVDGTVAARGAQNITPKALH